MIRPTPDSINRINETAATKPDTLVKYHGHETFTRSTNPLETEDLGVFSTTIFDCSADESKTAEAFLVVKAPPTVITPSSVTIIRSRILRMNNT